MTAPLTLQPAVRVIVGAAAACPPPGCQRAAYELPTYKHDGQAASCCCARGCPSLVVLAALAGVPPGWPEGNVRTGQTFICSQL